MKLRALLAGLLAACLTLPASGYWQSRDQSFVATSGYSGPGDIVSGAIHWSSCSYGYNAADVADACDVCLPSDTTCAHITLTAGVAVVPGSLSTCNITTVICTVKTAFDKGSKAKDITQATEANRPTFRPAMASNGCPTTSNPCIRLSGASTNFLTVNESSTVSQPFSFAFVITKNSSSGSSGIFGTLGGNLFFASGNTVILNAGSSLVGSALTSNTFYVFLGIANGASSAIIRNNTSDASGNAGSNGWSSGNPVRLGSDASTGCQCTVGEFGAWNIAFDATQQGNLTTNMKTTRWGF